ncbi:hypothetical protein [Salinispira pacifica]
MELLEIRNITRKDAAVLYRRTFSGEAILKYDELTTRARRVAFVLEHTPTAGVQIQAEFLDLPDYPLVPAIRMLKEHILALDKRGLLP